jgi:hypothetical protein
LRRNQEVGSAEPEDMELLSLLEAFLDGRKASQEPPPFSGAVIPKGSTSRPSGEVLRLSVFTAMDQDTQTLLRQALVQINGVMSVAFETNQIVAIGARSVDLATDPTFAQDVSTAAAEALQGLKGDVGVAAAENAGCARAPHQLPFGELEREATNSSDEPAYIDDDEDDNSPELVTHSTSSASGCKFNEDPSYLDDSEDEAGPRGKRLLPARPESKCWSFFSHAGFFSAQRLQEYEDDPTLVARLQRAHLRLEHRRREEQMRLQRVLKVITPLRSGARIDAVKHSEYDEIPGVE